MAKIPNRGWLGLSSNEYDEKCPCCHEKIKAKQIYESLRVDEDGERYLLCPQCEKWLRLTGTDRRGCVWECLSELYIYVIGGAIILGWLVLTETWSGYVKYMVGATILFLFLIAAYYKQKWTGFLTIFEDDLHLEEWKNQCRECEYDLTGTKAGENCPECGRKKLGHPSTYPKLPPDEKRCK